MLLSLTDRREAVWDMEQRTLNDLKPYVHNHPLWKYYLVHVNGVGVAMAGVLISEIDIYKADMASKIISFAGIATGKTRGKIKRNGKIVVTDDLIAIDKKTKGYLRPYCQFLKDKLLGVLMGQFLKAHGKSFSKYAMIFYNRRQRREAMDWGEKSKRPKDPKKPRAAHQFADARRYAIKIFLIDLYVAWRTIEGLPVREPYEEEYLDKVHHTKDYDIDIATFVKKNMESDKMSA